MCSKPLLLNKETKLLLLNKGMKSKELKSEKIKKRKKKRAKADGSAVAVARRTEGG